jgi:hypothetical protein
MANTTLSAEQLWDIDRYLLGDETLDRGKFESRMLDDETLAQAVAEELERLQLLSMSTEREWVCLGTNAANVSRKRWLVPGAMLAVVASLMGFMFVWPRADERLVEVTASPQMQELAQEWLALDSLAEDPEFFELPSESELTALDTGDSSSDLVGEDWMMVASEFFRNADI